MIVMMLLRLLLLMARITRRVESRRESSSCELVFLSPFAGPPLLLLLQPDRNNGKRCWAAGSQDRPPPWFRSSACNTAHNGILAVNVGKNDPREVIFKPWDKG
uniref:Putative secreted protein n=1 Tax=Anopheles marajoara TaxID=58244 RepID=A0A2M4C8J0_9DIPT